MSKRQGATRVIALICSALLLSACMQDKTPQEVTRDFWEAVAADKPAEVAENSTLADVAGYDGFGRDWHDVKPSFGKIVIDGDEASVATVLNGAGKSAPLEIDTYLVRSAGEWKVDYARTGSQLGEGAFGALVGKLERFGSSVGEQLKAASEGFAASTQRMGETLDEAAAEIGGQTSGDVGEYGEELRKNIDALGDSAEQALRNEERRFSAHERRVLEDVVASLDRGSEALSELTFASIADGAKTLADAREQLDAIDNKALEPYQDQWREWGARIEAETEKALGALLREKDAASAASE